MRFRDLGKAQPPRRPSFTEIPGVLRLSPSNRFLAERPTIGQRPRRKRPEAPNQTTHNERRKRLEDRVDPGSRRGPSASARRSAARWGSSGTQSCSAWAGSLVATGSSRVSSALRAAWTPPPHGRTDLPHWRLQIHGRWVSLSASVRCFGLEGPACASWAARWSRARSWPVGPACP